ncbi:lysophospholipid acyltransferase 5-like [Amphiura filiformis]|uniref:lysophospholipid acyltransferase 5-like n=1 Tax=Amphiura filiformis TaxID=82378 RepID=UPI003B21C700
MATTMEKDDTGMVEGILQTIADLAGAKEPIIRLLLSMLFSYVLAAILRSVLHGFPATLKHIYFIVTGLALAYFNYGYGTIHSLGAILVNYVMLLVIGGTPISALLSLVGNLGYLVGAYYYMSTDDYDVNWTTPHCVLTLRLIGLAWDLYDGNKPESRQSKEQKSICIRTPPSPLEILGYCYYFGGFFVGPQFPIRRYYDFVNDRLLDNSEGKPSDSVRPALIRLGHASLYISLSVFIAPYYTNEYLLSDEFLNETSFWYKLFVVAIWGEFKLWHYCSAWLISEGVCILSGITYEGRDATGAPNWKGCNNVRISQLESAVTLRQVIAAFNINTNVWVARYVYKRLKFLGNKVISQAVTLLFLAVWHGYYIGYYICFFFELIIVQFELQWESVMAKTGLSKYYHHPVLAVPLWIFKRFYTMLFMGYPLVSFVFLQWYRIVQIYSSVYFCGHVLFLLIWPLLYHFVLRPSLRKSSKTTDPANSTKDGNAPVEEKKKEL